MPEEMYRYLYAIIKSRTKTFDISERMAYQSCLSMLEYAYFGDEEALRNYDYADVWSVLNKK